MISPSALCLLGACLLVADVHAEVTLLRSEPPDRAVLARVPDQLLLKFSTRLDKTQTHVKLDRADGSTQTLIDTAETPSVFRATLPQDLGPGHYVVSYKVLGGDGQAKQGVLRFMLQGQP